MNKNIVFLGINWSVRFKSKTWWLSVIPAGVMMVATIMSIFGVEVPKELIINKGNEVVTVIFVFLAALGSVDHTTDGISDSKQAQEYVAPREDL